MAEKLKLKNAIRELVATKVFLTKDRRDYKFATRGKVDEADRLSTLSDFDVKRRHQRQRIRHALLAYAYLRGRAYARVEAMTKNPPVAGDVVMEADDLAGVKLDLTRVQQWLAVRVEETKAAE